MDFEIVDFENTKDVLMKKTLDCLAKKELITFVELENVDGASNLDVAILQSLLKGTFIATESRMFLLLF